MCKLCVDKLCVSKLCVGRRRRTAAGGGGSAELKTRTPNKDVGKILWGSWQSSPAEHTACFA